MFSWKVLEENVKTLSSFKWNCPATNEVIEGVRFDCVLKQKDDYWIIVEASENNSLEKVRTDIAKFASVRYSLLGRQIYTECYLVLKGEPSESMQTTGAASKVKVLSYHSFSKLFLDFDSYSFIRIQKNFGSSVDPFSGEPDSSTYTPVQYEYYASKKGITLNEIGKNLLEGKRMVLFGNYGTGKSRCSRELFALLSQNATSRILYPIAINIKENWGTQRAEEIIRRHFEDLGLSIVSDSVIKILQSDRLIFILDGFDEIGTQVWSDDLFKLKQIRATSLIGVKDLIQKTKGAVIVTGREHYFNTNVEMFNALGLDQKDTILLNCKDEFSNEEMEQYLKSLSSLIDLPFWLPKRPLICQIINTIEKDKIESFFVDSDNAVEFWDTLIKNLCDREARIRAVLDSETIFEILKCIAKMTRGKIGNIGPLSINEINKAFEKVVGTPPIDESAIMLQRLPALGRISTENQDRQFIDYYILDGLRAESVLTIVNENLLSVLEEKWENPLQRFGIELIGRKIQSEHSATFYIEFLKRSAGTPNKILQGDLLTALVNSSTNSTLDMGGVSVNDASIAYFDLSKSMIDNFSVTDSIIDELDVSNCSFSKITFKDCFIKKIYGVGSENERPSFLASCSIDNYETKSVNSKNLRYNLSPAHMVLISLIKKLFVLSTESRVKSELLEGFAVSNRKIASDVMDILAKERVISKSIFKSDQTYTGKPHQRSRMKKILNELSHSKDQIWLEVAKIAF